MSLSGRGLSRSRGASVLAALVLVGILGVVYVAVQYAHDSLHFAGRTSASLTASAAISTQKPPDLAGCISLLGGMERCKCAQPSITPKAVSGSPSTIENCLPSCVYDVHPGKDIANPTIIVTEPNPQYSTNFSVNKALDNSQCTVKVCTSSDASSCVLASSKSPTLPSGGTGTGVGPDSQSPCVAGSLTNPCPSTTQTTPPSAGNADSGGYIGQALSGAQTSSGPDSQSPCIAGSLTNPCAPGTAPDSQSNCISGSLTNPCPNNTTSGAPCSLYDPCNQPTVQTNSDLSNVSGPNSANPCASNEVTINGICQEAPPGVSTSCASGEVLVAGNCQPSPPGVSTSCASGEVLVAGNCQPSPTTFKQSPAPNNNNNNNNSTSVGDISQFLQGLMKGLTGKGGGGGGGGGQQQQQNAPYGRGTDGAACYQPPVKPDPSTCNVGTWKSNSSSNNGCVTGWQCVPNTSTATQPTATLSCQPQTADAGMILSISYSCTNATGSSATGFDTQNALSGSTTTLIATPPSGANTASYGLTCTNGTQTASQQCAIQINKPWMSLVAIPSVVPKNGSSAIGWVTGGMKSCALSIMNASATSSNATDVDVSGVNTIFSIATTTLVSLKCQTLGGGMSQATSTIIIQ